MKIKELIELLQQYDEDFDVCLASDAEGNGFSNVDGTELGYRESEGPRADWSDQDTFSGIRSVGIWPVCIALAVMLCSSFALADPAPLRVTVNPRGPAALLPTHIGKGWPETIVPDARCSLSIDDPATPANENIGYDSMACYVKMTQLGKHGVGRYISHRLQDSVDYPPDSLPAGALNDNETIAYANRIWPDLRQPDVRRHAADVVLAELLARPAPYVLHDNLINGRIADSKYPFTIEQQCRYLQLVREGLEGKLICNWSGGISWWTDEDIRLVIDACDGFNAETGIHPNIRGKEAELRRQIAVMRRMVDAGMMVVLQSVNGSLTSDQDKADESRYTAAVAFMARRKVEDPIYKDHPFWQSAPDWQTLPMRAGEALHDITYRADGSMSRPYQKLVITIRPPRSVEIVEVTP